MFGHYLRAALRNFRRRPVTTAIKLLALTLGLACFLAAYVFADFLGRADTHWANSGRIYSIVQSVAPPGSTEMNPIQGAAPPVAKNLRADMPWLDAVGRITRPASTRMDGSATPVLVRAADPEILEIFDLEFVEGGSDALSRPHSAMISGDLAQRMFGGASAAMGQSLHLEQNNHTDVTVTAVLGDIPAPSMLAEPFGAFDMIVTMDAADDLVVPSFVAPPGAADSAGTDAFRAAFRRSEFDTWSFGFGETFVLFPRTGAPSRSAFDAQLAAFAERRVPKDVGQAQFEARSPQTNIADSIDNVVLQNSMASFSVRAILLGFGALVLAVACFNFASLSTSEAATRGREIGLRKTIGAGRRQVVAQTLMETAFLSAVALVLALILLGLALGAVRSAADIGLHLPGLNRIGFWAGLVAVLVGVSLLAGAYPALILANVRPQTAHQSGSMGGAGGRIRAVLSGAQFAVAAALLTGAFVIALQNSELRRTGLGVQEDPVLVVNLSFPVRPPADLARQSVVEAELLADPAVLDFSASQNGLFGGGAPSPERIALSPAEDAEASAFESRRVYPGFFSLLAEPMLAGRDFREGDIPDLTTGLASGEMRKVKAVIDAETAANFGMTPDGAVGQFLYLSSPYYSVSTTDGASEGRSVTEAEIIGVVAEPPMELRASPSGIYVYLGYDLQMMTPIIRISRQDVPGALEHIRSVYRDVVPDAQVDIRFLDEQFDQAFRSFSRISNALVALCALAVLIAAAGMFGMANFAVQRRVREVGVRKVLGARSAQVMALLLWDFSKPVIVAALIAWPVAWLAAQTYLNLFVTRIPLTPTPFLASMAASLIVAWLAVGAQAWRAASVKPANVLSYE